MMFVAILLGLVASSYAFRVTSPRASRTTSQLSMSDKSKSIPFLGQPANLVGMVGDVGFDPLGFSNSIDVRFLREAELKHARIAMLAVVGLIGAEFFKLPGEVHAVGAVAAHDTAVQSGALGQILLWTSFFEIISTKAVLEMLDGSGRQPGDFGFDPLNFYNGKSEKVKNELALKEIKNGRLAMIAFGGLITQAVVTEKGFPFF